MITVTIYTMRGHPPKDINAGVITYDELSGLRSVASDPQYETLIKNIMGSSIAPGPGPEQIDPATDPKKWIDNLYKEYKSYAVRATKAR